MIFDFSYFGQRCNVWPPAALGRRPALIAMLIPLPPSRPRRALPRTRNRNAGPRAGEGEARPPYAKPHLPSRAQVTKCLTDMRDEDRLSAVMKEDVRDWKPASTTICVNSLNQPGLRIEIDVTAVIRHSASCDVVRESPRLPFARLLAVGDQREAASCAGGALRALAQNNRSAPRREPPLVRDRTCDAL